MTNDILIIGGGVVGLAIAVELRSRGASVTLLCRDFHAAASHAAAGMLAPQAEQIPPGAMLDLCWRSRSLYPEWTRKLEEISGKPTGYWACGILAPVYEDVGAHGCAPLQENNSSPAYYLDREAIHLYQPGLSEAVEGGWWYPEDAQVDNRALTLALWSAAESLGVDLHDGIAVEGILQHQGRVIGVQTSSGNFPADRYILASGAWSSELLPLPVRPKKGQMLSVQIPDSDRGDATLQRVLYAPDVYIVPRRERRIIIGATSEDVGFTPYNTPAGIQALLQRAIRIYPQLQDYPIREFWWGFRPATPDELPILGNSPCSNLTLATGHYRNGILLAPITAKLIADLVWEQKSEPLLESFSYLRFMRGSREQGAGGEVKIQNSKFKISHTPHPENCQLSTKNQLPTTNYQLPTTNHLQMQTLDLPQQQSLDRPLVIADRTFSSRLMTGTGKYRNVEEMQQSVVASGCQIVTVAVRRVQTKAPGHENLAEALDWTKLWMLPNTAGCQTAEEAIRVARLGREMAKVLGQEDNNFVKLEVIPDPKYLLPDPIGTLQAAEQLVKEGFAVLPYINADPMLAKRLEEAGCVTVMPLASPIGSGQGLKTTANIQIIIENAGVPVVVDAGIGTPSEAAQAMELGADALLINTAIAQAKNPPAMARGMKLATEAGRLAYLAGRIPIKDYAIASSPLSGTVTS
ncbi:glycine oxidase ThiO [cyanobacterium TDX16]|nr:glycine oxidase ThiO [cyanobacterium TDX16]